MREVLRGTKEFLGRFVQRMKCVPRMLKSLNARLGRPLDEHELGDVGQDVLTIIWRKLPDFDGKSSLEAWAFRVCYLCMMNAARKARTRTSSVALGLEEEVAVSPRRPDPWEFEDVYLALDRLSEDDSRVLRLKHFEGLTFKEIGDHLGVPTNTVKTRYYRARLHMQELLAPEGAHG